MLCALVLNMPVRSTTVSLVLLGDEERITHPSQHSAHGRVRFRHVEPAAALGAHAADEPLIVVRYCLSCRLLASTADATAASTEDHIGLVPAAGARSQFLLFVSNQRDSSPFREGTRQRKTHATRAPWGTNSSRKALATHTWQIAYDLIAIGYEGGAGRKFAIIYVLFNRPMY